MLHAYSYADIGYYKYFMLVFYFRRCIFSPYDSTGRQPCLFWSVSLINVAVVILLTVLSVTFSRVSLACGAVLIVPGFPFLNLGIIPCVTLFHTMARCDVTVPLCRKFLATDSDYARDV